MAATNERTHQRESTAYAKKRDAEILAVADVHVVTAAVLVFLNLFATKPKARKRLRTLHKRKKLKLLGFAQLGNGPPEKVYGRVNVPFHKAEHELIVTLIVLRILAQRVIRGYEVDERQADAELLINDATHYLEADTGSMGYKEIVGRMKNYIGSPHDVLWVCMSESRMAGLIERARILGLGNAWFTTFDRVMEHTPHAEIWTNTAGETGGLDRACAPAQVPGHDPGRSRD